MRKICILILALGTVCHFAGAAYSQLAPQRQYQDPRGNNANQPATGARTVINGQSQQARASQAQQPRVPEGFQLTPDQQQWVDQVLGYWEHRSDKVNSFTTAFYCYEFNPAQVKDRPWSRSKGEIKYAKPDKAMYRVDEVQHWVPPNEEVPKGGYVKREDAQHAHWICDGQSTFEFDTLNKLLIERPLPPQMQGEAIADGPLPFLFGAEAAKLKQRYWFAPIVPPIDPKTGKPSEKEFWLNAKPKSLEDAQNFSQVKIVIDRSDFLPRELHIYMPGGQEYKVFQFTDRTENPRLEFLRRDFSKPSVPFGWKKKVENIPRTAPPAQARRGMQIPVPQRR